MSRYEWPAVRGGNPDNASARAEFLRAYRAAPTAEALERALRQRRRLTLPAGVAAFAPAVDNTNMWVPVGPTSVVRGQARFKPRISGRVRDMAVSDDGERVYAATANGGVWYSADSGASWMPVGAWTSAVRAEVTTRATPLTCGCLLVDFGDDPTGADDDVFVGTGEIEPSAGGVPGGQLGGVGVLFSHGPVPKALADPLGNPWEREGKNLRGFGIYRLARQPDNPDLIVAATSHGLWTRSGPPTADSEWTPVTAEPFDQARPDLDDSNFLCTDLVWVEERPEPPSISARLYVCVNDTRQKLFDDDSGLWVSETGVDGPFRSVKLSGKEFNSRFGIARAPNDERVLYVLGKGPHLWRVQAQSSDIDDIEAHEVERVPVHLFGRGDKDQSHYDLAVAVDPENAGRIVLGGKSVELGDHNAALFRCAVQQDGGNFRLDYSVEEKDDERDETKQAADKTFIGEGIHSDVHQILWKGVGSRRDMWVACDGGVFRSRADGDRGSFVARNTGLATLEAGYVAGHPTNDVAMLIGTQDNGVLKRIGDTLWEYVLSGDGGGVAYHPRTPRRLVGQYTRGQWRNEHDHHFKIVKRSPGRDFTDSEKTENNASAFYSGVAVRATAAGGVRLAVGSVRVWLSEDFGVSWKTLPSLDDPRRRKDGSDRENWKDDVPFLPVISWFAKPPPDAMVVALRWVDDDRLLVLCRGAVFLYDYIETRDKPWRRTLVTRYKQPSCDTIDPGEVTSPAEELMPIGRWSDIAVHADGKGTKGCGSFYVTTTGPPKGDRPEDAPNADTLWWFDGTSRWYVTGLRSAADGVPAPAYAVAVDPWNPEFVYVGTSIGVWRGQFDEDPDGLPSWDWSPVNGNGPFVNGLPEAAVQDLSFFERRDPPQPLLLLRAALQARGVWEVDLRRDLTPQTYLRVHPYDSRRVSPTAMPGPLDGLNTSAWHVSPDVRARPAPGAPIPAPVSLPWPETGPRTDEMSWQWWLFQVALHHIDPLVRPDGRWTEAYDARLRIRRAELGLPDADAARVDAALWNAVMTPEHAFADPWYEGPGPMDVHEPTEADLHELVFDEPGFWLGAGTPLLAGPAKFDVLVHHRHGRAAPANEVFVTVVSAELPVDTADWASMPVPWMADVVALLHNNGVPPTEWTQPDPPWMVGSGTVPSLTPSGPLFRQPTGPVDPRTPRVVTFDLDFTGAGTLSAWAVVAVVHSVADPVVLTGATLQDLVMNNRHVAVRTVEI